MVAIHLTPEGHALIARVFPQHAKDIANELSVLRAEEQDELRRICRKLGKGAAELCQERQTKQQLNRETQNATDSTQ